MDEHQFLAILQSWESSYIATPARIAFRDARLLIEKKNAEIEELKKEFGVILQEIAALRADLDDTEKKVEDNNVNSNANRKGRRV